MTNPGSLSSDQIITFLSVYKNAIALYTTENIVLQYANKAMLAFWDRDESVIGLPLDVALPEIQDQPFMDMLRAVYHTGVDDVGESIRADLLVNGQLQTFYFDYAYRAIKDEAGKTICIMHTAEDVTEKTQNRDTLSKAQKTREALQREQALNEELAAANEELFSTNEQLNNTQNTLGQLNMELEERVASRTKALTESEARLRYMLAEAPIAISLLTGKEFIVEAANRKVLEAWGKDNSIIGAPLHLAVPELIGQEFLNLLTNVYVTGVPYYGNEVKALLEQNGRIEEVYSNFVYYPLKDDTGNTFSIVLIANVVTEQVVARQKLQALNAALSETNDALRASRTDLEKVNRELMASEHKLDQIISQVPTPIVVLQGPDQVISTTNDALLSFWEKTNEDIIGRPMLEVFPELKSQPFPAQWKHVLETGETIANRERPVTFNRPYGKRLYYVDYYYQPLSDADGNRYAVLATVIDVTDKVQARQSVEQAEAKLRQAIDSSELGTWYIDTATREFVPSPRLKEIFGFLHDEEMPYEAALDQITDNYRKEVTLAVEQAITHHEGYELEYTIRGRKDNQLRWVRATGKVYLSNGITPANFSGTLMDITARKLEEQRKDDFISIASHELKTPTTSLKASLQLMDRMKDKPDQKIFAHLVTQANRSVNKLAALIQDLLNSSRATEGQLKLNKTEFTIAEMLNNYCNHVRVAGKYNLKLQGDEQLRIYADEQQIDQVVVNLVDNAVKYAPEGKEIILTVSKEEHMAKISVKDTGPGIPAEKLPHLFNRYYQADHNGGQYSGLGLGLYISSEIIKKHGGKMGVESELGKGTTFWFTLPV